MTLRWRDPAVLGLKVGLMFLILIFAYNCVNAAELRIKWDASVGALGYKAHHGLTTGEYVTEVDAGDVLRYDTHRPAECHVLHRRHRLQRSGRLGVQQRACDVASSRGGLVRRGLHGWACLARSVSGRMAGANYGPNIVVDIPYEGVTVGLVVRESPTAVTVPFTIAPTAPGGSADVVVSGPDTPGSIVTFPGLVTITPTVKPAAPTGLANE